MDFNYQHLFYFWTTAREGSISAASRKLRLTQPTVSAQLRTLEVQLGEKLFRRKGRGLELTEAGVLAVQYAEEIFSLGQEFRQNLSAVGSHKSRRLHVGIADVLPKMITHNLLSPALKTNPPTHLICGVDKTERLLAELSIQRLDLVLSDSPISGSVRVRAFNHLLGESGVSFFATAALQERYRRGFPESLDGAPMLMPTSDTQMRRALEQWFDRLRVRPNVVAEFHDSALLKVFGRFGDGIFAGPTVIESGIKSEYNVEVVGRTDQVREAFYAITVERKLKHPTVVAITEHARLKLFRKQSRRRK